MIPISLDSDVTQSVYGIGWSSCTEEQSGGAHVALFGVTGLQLMLLSLLVMCLFI